MPGVDTADVRALEYGGELWIWIVVLVPVILIGLAFYYEHTLVAYQGLPLIQSILDIPEALFNGIADSIKTIFHDLGTIKLLIGLFFPSF